MGEFRVCINRLQKEYLELQRKPEKQFIARPSPNNLLEWHYVLNGPEGTEFEGGLYHGQLIFSPDYPLKPPSILMTTPSARFECNTRICLTMSDFHPESWSPFWNVSTILHGLVSFMTEDASGSIGSISAPKSVRMNYAAQSKNFNYRNPTFKKLFPEMYKELKKEIKEKSIEKKSSSSFQSSSYTSSAANNSSNKETVNKKQKQQQQQEKPVQKPTTEFILQHEKQREQQELQQDRQQKIKLICISIIIIIIAIIAFYIRS